MGHVKQKWIVCIAIVFLLWMNWTSRISAEEVVRLSLKECILLALEQHSLIQSAKCTLIEAELELEKLKLEDPRGVAKKVLQEKESAVFLAHQALEQARMNLALEVESGYYRILKEIQILKSKEESVQWTKRQMNIAKVKYESGMISAKDFLAIEDQLKQVEKDLVLMQFNYDTARMEFNLLIGCELEYKFEVVDEQLPFEPIELTLEDSLAYALTHAVSIEQAKTAVLQAKETLEFKRVSGVSQLELRKAEHSLMKAEAAKKDAENAMVITIRNAVMGLRSGYDGVIDARKQCEKTAQDLEVVKIKYDAGMIPLVEMIAARKKLEEAQMQGIQVIYNYNLLKASFYRTIGKGYSLYEEIKDEKQGSDQ